MTIPQGIRKPGVYGDFNLYAGAQGLQGTAYNMLIFAPMLASGTATPLETTTAFTEAEAGLKFGFGSTAHLMVKASLIANPYASIDICPVEDNGAAIKATSTFTVVGTATETQNITAYGLNKPVTISVLKDDTETEVADKITLALNNSSEALPFTSANTAGAGTLTARNGGTYLNGMYFDIIGEVAGLTLTTTGFASGATDTVLTGTSGPLESIFAGSFSVIAHPWTDDTNTVAIRDHIEVVSGGLEQRPSIAGMALTEAFGVVADVKTLTGTTLNHWRTTAGYVRGIRTAAFELSAIYGSVIVSEDNPNKPINGLVLKGADIPSVENRIGRTEQEDLLSSGVTPFEVNSSSQLVIVRAITTNTTNPQATPDDTLLDIGTPRALDYVRASCRLAVQNGYANVKNSARVRNKIRLTLLTVLRTLADPEIEVTQNVEENAGLLTVSENLTDGTRADAIIPADIIDGLHIVAMTINLL